MATLSRVKTYVTGDELTATQTNDIQDLLIDLLDGTTTNVNVVLRYDNSDAATLKIDNTGAGVLLDLQVGGVQKALVNATGQIESTIATGTPPLVVASTTRVANLNVATAGDADSLGGTAASSYALKTYVDAKVYSWTHAFFIEQPDLGGTSDAAMALAGFICPDGATFTFDRARYVYASGSPTGNSTVDIEHYDATGALQNTFTVTLNSTDNTGDTYDANFADTTMADGDYMILVAGTDNAHRDITIQLEGTETVV